MWSDILNKPNQGKVFRLFRGELINVNKYYDNKVQCSSTNPTLLSEYERIISRPNVFWKITENNSKFNQYKHKDMIIPNRTFRRE